MRTIFTSACSPQCMEDNSCKGSVMCNECHVYVCPNEIDRHGYCPKCSERRVTCDNCGDSALEECSITDNRGRTFCCSECAEEYAHENYATIMCDVCGKEKPEHEVHDGCCEQCLNEMLNRKER